MKKKLIGFILATTLVAIVFAGCTGGEGTRADQARNGLASFVSISPDDEQILFSYYIEGIASIYKANVDGTGIEQITSPTNEDHLRPTFSPDGLKILFLKFPHNTEDPKSEIYLMNLDGTEEEQITDNKAHITHAIFSPDGNKIYFLESGYFGHYSPIASSHPHDFDIYSIDIDGSNITRITYLEEYEMMGISINSKGTELIYSIYDENNPVHLLSLTNDTTISFKPSGKYRSESFYTLVFSPIDDKKIVFISVSPVYEGSYEYELFLYDIVLDDPIQLTNLHKHADDPCFFNSGNTILFIQDQNWPNSWKTSENNILMRIDIDGTNLGSIGLDLPGYQILDNQNPDDDDDTDDDAGGVPGVVIGITIVFIILIIAVVCVVVFLMWKKNKTEQEESNQHGKGEGQ